LRETDENRNRGAGAKRGDRPEQSRERIRPDAVETAKDFSSPFGREIRLNESGQEDEDRQKDENLDDVIEEERQALIPDRLLA